MKLLVAFLLLSFSALSSAGAPLNSTYENLVDGSGNISLPSNFQQNWIFVGTWSIAAEDADDISAASGHGAAGLHNVYTQTETVEYFRQNGKFPDGAVFIKELLNTLTESMTTGTVSRGSQVEGWFIMVKDTKGRFSSNPLWGDGWGWALFKPDQPDKTVTQNYKTECLGCHIPARKDDWIYTMGYPLLRSR